MDAAHRIGVGLFAKRPRPGEVKTRLAPVLGASGAAGFARALLDDGVARFESLGARFELVFAPAEEQPWFAANYTGVTLRAQVGAGLAERLEHWFAHRPPGHPWAAVGSDAPWCDPARAAAAAELLAAGADVVLGPDAGGGYDLVALAAPQPGLFTDIQMSTRSMCDETRAWCAARGLEVALLPPDYDVDDAEDWKRLCADLAAGRGGPGQRHVAAFVSTSDAQVARET